LIINGIRIRNKIVHVNILCVRNEDPKIINKKVKSFYKNKLKGDKSFKLTLERISTLTLVDNMNLTRKFLKDVKIL